MSRLTHTPGGMRRLMEMSEAALFLLIEGQTDLAFYSGLCDQALQGVGLRYEVRTAEAVTGQPGSGGRETLLRMYSECAENGWLSWTCKGKRTAVLFFVDRDIDIWHASVSSRHLVYTRYYHVENYYYLFGDLARACSVAGDIDYERCRMRVGNAVAWCRAAAAAWEKWVVFCLYVHRYSLDCRCGYKRESWINDPQFEASLNAERTRDVEDQLCLASGMGAVQFEATIREVAELVGKVFGRGEHDLVFRGKWYLGFLCHEIADMCAELRLRRHALRNVVRAAVMATLDFSAQWADHLREPLLEVAGDVSPW